MEKNLIESEKYLDNIIGKTLAEEVPLDERQKVSRRSIS